MAAAVFSLSTAQQTGELSENILQNLLNKLPAQTVAQQGISLNIHVGPLNKLGPFAEPEFCV